ncbi:MAG: TolC family protein [Acidobacteria bacterium]|nr:TolC family protein [Acidobacteriota bacterium]
MAGYIDALMKYLLLSASLLAGCATYHPQPIDPPRLEKEYHERSLSSPGLRAFMEASSAPKPAEWPLKEWTLAQLTLAGFYFSPELDMARARLELAEAGIRTAGARPNPSIALAPGYSASPESALQFRVTPSFPIETAGKRGYRILEAEKLAEAARLELAEAGWRVRTGIRANLVDHLLALRERDLLAAEENVRSEAVAILEQRLAAGEVSRPDVDSARTELMNTSLLLKSAEGRVAETLAALAGSAGLPVSGFEGIAFDWPRFDQPPAEEALPLAAVQRAGLLNRIDVRRVLAEYAAADAALRLELAKQYPDIVLGPGYDFDEGHHKFTLGLALTLPIFNRNQGPIAAAEARRKETAARFTALQALAIGEMERALAQYRSALAQLTQAAAQGAALQQAKENTARRAVEVGEMDRLALAGISVQRAVVERARLEALRKTRAALGALEQSVQLALDSGLRLPEVSTRSPREVSPPGGEK